jgi:parvulin-like peptidyl-prolyl isomerase
MKSKYINIISLHTRGTISKILAFIVLLTSISMARENHPSNSDTLAVIGNRIITVERFAKLLKEKIVGLGLIDNSEIRMGYLYNLTDDEILILQAKKRKLDRTKKALAEKSRIELQELLNAFLNKYISPMAAVTENDLRDLFWKMNTKIKVSHLYAQTKAFADSLYDELLKGRSFNELARKVFADPRLKESGGSLGYISIDEMDPEFEKTAYGMSVGEISKPVKTVYGYSIIKVDDIKGNPFVTENEFFKVRDRLKGFAYKRKYEEAAKQYIKTLRAELNLHFNDAYVSRLYEILLSESFQFLIENKSPSIFHEDLEKTVLTTTEERWSVNRLINALSKTDEKQRKWIRTKENFEDFIAGLVMRKYISNVAKKEKLDAAPSFHENVQYEFDSYLLTTLEKQLKKQIKISEDSVKSFFRHNREKFRTQPEIRLSTILVDDAILADSIRKSLNNGVQFPELAKQFSIQKIIAERDGDLGFFRKDELGSLGVKLFDLNVGEWTGPIVEEGKSLFVKCTDRKEPADRSFEESSQEIKEMLTSMVWLDVRSQYVKSLKEEIDCKIYPERVLAISFN